MLDLLSSIFSKMKNTFLELIYQLEDTHVANSRTSLKGEFSYRNHLNAMKSSVGLVCGQVLTIITQGPEQY